MLHRWLFTLESRPPLHTTTTLRQLGVGDDNKPLTFTHYGDLHPIQREEIERYNLPADAKGHIGQFSHYEAQS